MSVFWGRRGDMWEPQGGERKEWRDLQPGDLLANGRKIWQVHEVRPVPVADWEEGDREAYRLRNWARVAEEFWRHRPLYLIVSPVQGGKRRHVKVRPYGGAGRQAYVLHPHYPVCRKCGEPWPCPELDIKRELDKSAAEMTRLEGIMPGCCWCCGEPVTVRQQSIMFDGENLLLPGGPPVAFHLSGSRKGRDGDYCFRAARTYEERWVPAGEGRCWRISCPGRSIRHVDGLECGEPGCPGPGAQHGGDVMTHRFQRTGSGAILPVPGYGGDKCRRCLDAVEGGIFDRAAREVP